MNSIYEVRILIVDDNKDLLRLLCEQLSGAGYRHIQTAANCAAAKKLFAAEIAKAEVVLELKVGEGGKLFGAVSSKEIAQAAKEQLNMELDKKKLVLPNPIKTVGTTSVSVKLHPQVTAELKVVVKEA